MTLLTDDSAHGVIMQLLIRPLIMRHIEVKNTDIRC